MPHTSSPAQTASHSWQDLLAAALAGLYPTDQQLERMLDRLEWMP